MKRRELGIVVTLFLLGGAPAHAYADPSGGTLFQILMPAMAALWAMWMILAKRVQKGFLAFCRKLRGVEPQVKPDEPAT